MTRTILSLLVPILILLPTVEAAAPPSNEVPLPLAEVGFDQRLGESVRLDLPFTDERGRPVLLGDFFGERPVLMALVYFDCPMLCTLVLNGLTSVARSLEFEPGREFEIVVVSFDDRETPEQARTAKALYTERYGRPGTEGGWHFLTGDRKSIGALTSAVGFRYSYDAEADQFAHAAGILALTPDGRVARYFYGIEYAPRDVRLGLVEAADGGIGTVVDQVLLYCFHYDPVVGRYSAAAMNLLRLAAAVTLLALGGFLLVQWRRERRRQPAGAGV